MGPFSFVIASGWMGTTYYVIASGFRLEYRPDLAKSGQNPTESGQNPFESGQIRPNPAEPGQNPAEFG